MLQRPTSWSAALLLVAVLAGCTSQPPRTPTSQQPQKPQTSTSEQLGSGKASYYGRQHHNKLTASGERFDQSSLTAAHRTLPFGSKVRVTNTRTGKSVIVRINDRGPFVRSRVIDLSKAAFERIGSTRSGVIRVRLEQVE